MIRARMAFFAAFAALAGALLVTGCDRDKDREKVRSETAATAGTPVPPATSVGRGATATATATPGAVVVRDEDIPTIADFEDQAEKEITAANMEAQLARLEKDIAAETAPAEGAAPHRGHP